MDRRWRDKTGPGNMLGFCSSRLHCSLCWVHCLVSHCKRRRWLLPLYMCAVGLTLWRKCKFSVFSDAGCVLFLLSFPALSPITFYIFVCLPCFSCAIIRPIQFGIVVTSWQLPYCMMIIDCLSVSDSGLYVFFANVCCCCRGWIAKVFNSVQRKISLWNNIFVHDSQQQNIGAAWPHVLGIFTGHFYHFFTKIWPELGGRAWLATPKWLIRKLGGKEGEPIPKEEVNSKGAKTVKRGRAKFIVRKTPAKLSKP